MKKKNYNIIFTILLILIFIIFYKIGYLKQEELTSNVGCDLNAPTNSIGEEFIVKTYLNPNRISIENIDSKFWIGKISGLGKSMKPILSSNSILIGIQTQDIYKGDIVVFSTSGNIPEVNNQYQNLYNLKVERILEINGDDIFTKADASSDVHTITKDKIFTKIVFVLY